MESRLHVRMPRTHLKGVVSFFLNYFCCCLFVLSLKDSVTDLRWSWRKTGILGVVSDSCFTTELHLPRMFLNELRICLCKQLA